MTMPNGGALPNMPPGISSPDSNPATDNPSQAPVIPTNRGQFSPPFRIGLGKSGVYTDPRQQIAGGPGTDLNTPPPTPAPAAAPAPAAGAGNIAGAGTLNGAGGNGNQPYAPKLNLPGTIDQQVQEGMNY